jgi:NAD(P)-dependent dehydrogenase (short-subunit alcohol dehydrogenase family)
MTSFARPSPDDLAKDVKSKVILITGSASGIGLAIASLLAAHGAQLIIVDLKEDRCEAAVKSVGHGAVYKTCDVSSWEQQLSLFEWVVDEFGALDVVMANAGIDPEMDNSMADGHPLKEKSRGRVFFDFSGDEMETAPGARDSRDLQALFSILTLWAVCTA